MSNSEYLTKDKLLAMKFYASESLKCLENNRGKAQAPNEFGFNMNVEDQISNIRAYVEDINRYLKAYEGS